LFGSFYALNGVFVYPIGSSTISPKAFGFMGGHTTTRGELWGSEATRFLLLKDRNVLQTGYAARTQIGSYHGIEIRGNRRTDAAPSYSVPSGGNDNINTVVYSETNCLGFIVDSVPGVVQATWPVASFRRSNVELFRFGWGGEFRYSGAYEPSVVDVTATRPLIYEYEPFAYYRVDTSTGARTIRVPSPQDIGAARKIWIKKTNGTGGGDLTLEVVGGGWIESETPGRITWVWTGATNGQISIIFMARPDGTANGRGTWYFW
jgi:hypothetical protein